MAEVLGFVASVIAVIQLTESVITASKHFLDNLQDCPHDVRVILVEVSTLKALLESLKVLAEADHARTDSSTSLLQQLDGPNGTLEACRKSVSELEKLLPTTIKKQHGKRRRVVAAAAESLAWPLKQARAQRLLQEIQQYKMSITVALTSESGQVTCATLLVYYL